jgi:hypothetical protein
MHTWDPSARTPGDLEQTYWPQVDAPHWWTQPATYRVARRIYANRYLIALLAVFGFMCVYVLSLLMRTEYPQPAHDDSAEELSVRLFAAATVSDRNCMHVQQLGEYGRSIAVVAGRVYIDFDVESVGGTQHQIEYESALCPGETDKGVFSLQLRLKSRNNEDVLLFGQDAYCAQRMLAMSQRGERTCV